MKLTYFGHACFGIEAAGRHLLFDPFISPNPLAAGIDVDAVPADAIFLSHGHVDHVADAVRIARRTGACVVANWEIAGWLERQGVENVLPMNHGGSVQLDGIKARMTSAIHSSSLPDGSYGGNPGGFVVSGSNDSFYYSGDTALTMDMKMIGEEESLRFAVLPIGDTFTMGVADAIKAARWTGARDVVGVHYNTFPPIAIDIAQAISSFESAGLRLHLPAIGASLEFSRS